MERRIRVHRLIAAGMMLLVAACGGGDAGTDTRAPEGETDLVIGSDVPDFFPQDFPIPDEMKISGATNNDAAISLSGTFESGDPAAIQSEVVEGLQAAGYELLLDGDTAVLVKNGVGRVRIRTRDFLGELTMTVDIDKWTDAQLDELRAPFAEEVTVSGRATADFGGETQEASGECILKGQSRSFFAEDGSITIQIDETRDPTYVFADVTTEDGRVFYTENEGDFSYQASNESFSASGDMIAYNDEAGGTVTFNVVATCDT